MPLLFPVQEADGSVGHVRLYYERSPIGKIRGVRAAPPGSGRVELSPDYDLETELASEELGFGTSEALRIKRLWEKDPRYFLLDFKTMPLFFENLVAQGTEALASEDDVLDLIAQTAVELMIQGPLTIDEAVYVHDVARSYPPFGRKRAIDRSITDIALQAFRSGDYDVFNVLEKIATEPLYRIKKKARCERHDLGTYAECTIYVELWITGARVDKFTVRGSGGFRRADLEGWGFEVDDDSEEPTECSMGFLDYMGQPVDGYGFLWEEPKLQRPDVPLPEWSQVGVGRYGVFINDLFMGLFQNQADAIRFADMSNATAEREGTFEHVFVGKLAPMEKIKTYYEQIGEEFDPDNLDYSDPDLWEDI
jgi:hypothetical protein